MKLYAFYGGTEKATMAAFDPFHPEVTKLVDIPYFFYLIQHPLGNVLFDTGCHPDLITDPGKRLGDAGDDFGFALDIQEGDDVVSRLAEVGLQPSDISYVVQSHLHFDHAGGIEFFPAATFYANRRELQAGFWPPPYQESIYVQADFDHPVRWQPLTGWHDLFGDGRLVIFPTPGHSPGHQSLLVKLDNQNVILVADAAYLPRSLELGVLPAVVSSPDAMVESWDLLKHVQADHDAQLIFCHDLDWRGKTLVGPDQWYE
jgi:glyoxylase-like metal-dependent hydrolase (beta-lactamase superfamily II)